MSAMSSLVLVVGGFDFCGTPPPPPTARRFANCSFSCSPSSWKAMRVIFKVLSVVSARIVAVRGSSLRSAFSPK